MRVYLTIFVTVLLAELGDKTQLATVLFAADPELKRWAVFVAAAGALVLSTVIAVAVGTQIAAWLPARALRVLAGTGFVLIGAWMLLAR